MTSRGAAWLTLATLVACSGTPERTSTARAQVTSPRLPELVPAPPAQDAGPADADVPETSLPSAPALPTASAPPRFAPPHARTASPDDGQWSALASHEGTALLYQATVHPSPTKGQAKVTVVAIDLARVALRLVAGTREPVSPKTMTSARPGIVPLDDHPLLIAVTNGGWPGVDCSLFCCSSSISGPVRGIGVIIRKGIMSQRQVCSTMRGLPEVWHSCSRIPALRPT